MHPATLSACMMVKNEAALLEGCIKSIRSLVDELVIVDTGSTDGTEEIARRHADVFGVFPWTGNSSEAFNYVTSLATQDYLLQWDADFRLHPQSVPRLATAKNEGFSGANLISLRWNTELSAEGKALSWTQRDLIFARGDFSWEYPVHLRAVPLPGVEIRTKAYPAIEVDHLKDPLKKQFRYVDSISRTKAYLDAHPDDPYFLMAYAEELVFERRYDEAEGPLRAFLDISTGQTGTARLKRSAALERLAVCLMVSGRASEALSLLDAHAEELGEELAISVVRGDLYALDNPEKAMAEYVNVTEKLAALRFLENADHNRLFVHPRFMLAKLSLGLGDQEAARRWAAQALSVARRPEVREAIQLFLRALPRP